MDAAEANTVMKLDDSLLLKYVLHIHIPTTKYMGKYIRTYVCSHVNQQYAVFSVRSETSII